MKACEVLVSAPWPLHHLVRLRLTVSTRAVMNRVVLAPPSICRGLYAHLLYDDWCHFGKRYRVSDAERGQERSRLGETTPWCHKPPGLKDSFRSTLWSNGKELKSIRNICRTLFTFTYSQKSAVCRRCVLSMFSTVKGGVWFYQDVQRAKRRSLQTELLPQLLRFFGIQISAHYHQRWPAHGTNRHAC